MAAALVHVEQQQQAYVQRREADCQAKSGQLTNIPHPYDA
jgi:hypothetical protein